MLRPVAWIVAALAAGYALHALAQARFDARANATPIGTSSSNGISFAWFFDPTDRTVYVCRTGGAGDAVECKGRAQLP
jgi:hypothetical protein